MIGQNTDEQYIEMPERYTRRALNALYREIPLKDADFRLLRRYFRAMANLYGVISLYKAKEIIFSQNPKLANEETFLAFAEIARHECENYCILGGDEVYLDVEQTRPLDREIINVSLLDGDSALYFELKDSQRGKPYFVPDKNQLLAYEDSLFCEETPEKSALQRFMGDELGLSGEKMEDVFGGLLDGIRWTSNSEERILSYFDEMDIHFQSKRDAENFFQLYSAFSNATRMACNRGFTPDEMTRMKPPEERGKALSIGSNIRRAIQTGEMDIDDIRKQVIEMELPNEAVRFELLKQLAEIKPPAVQTGKRRKIGRNDPCPCGSGKKYKKCCGK